jgi:hypothetical protein
MTIPTIKALPKKLETTDKMITFVVLKPLTLILLATRIVGGKLAVIVGAGVGENDGGLDVKGFVATCLEAIIPICSYYNRLISNIDASKVSPQ